MLWLASATGNGCGWLVWSAAVNSNHPFVLVEMVGLAGSGKSSLGAAIERHIEQLVTERAGAGGSRGCSPAIGRSCLAWFRLVIGQAISLRSLSVWLDIVRTLLRLQSFSSRGGIHVVDEGLLHKFRSVRRLSPARLTLDAAVSRFGGDTLFPIPSDIIVCVNVTPETYAERLMKRDGKQVDVEKARRAVDNMQYTYADIQCCQRVNRSLEVISVDNDEGASLESNALLIAEKVAKTYRQRIAQLRLESSCAGR